MNQIAHPQTTFNPFNRNRAILFSAVAVTLAFLSFHGTLDDLAFSKLDELTKQSIALLAVSRGINGIVSVLQSIEFGAIVSSVQIGQVLDPIDDAAERLSVALMWAIGSLFLQDILLKIASGWMLKWAFLVITVLTAGTLLFAQSDRLRTTVVATFGVSHVALAQFQGLLVKTFVVATIFRFIVPTFAVVSFLISQALVAPEIAKHKGELEKSTKVVESISGPLSDPTDPEAEVRTLNEQKARLERQLESHLEKEEELTKRISETRESVLPNWLRIFGENSDEALVEASARVKDTESEINQKESELTCIKLGMIGKECESFLADHRKRVFGDLKLQLESQQTKLRENLRLLLETLEHWKGRVVALINKVNKAKDWDWPFIPGPVQGILGGDADNELKEANEKIKELEPKMADLKTSEEQKALELECVERLLAGERCDSLDEDEVVQPALARLLKERKEELESDLPPLRAKLVSLQGEQTRLAELVKFKKERGQIESRIEETKELIDGNELALECAERRVVGENCISLIDRIKMMTRGVLDRFTEIVGAAQDMVERMASILILVVIENIVLPIIFLAIAVKGSVPIARGVMRISTSIGEDTREALSALDQALPGRTN